jgi:hypothetical protein
MATKPLTMNDHQPEFEVFISIALCIYDSDSKISKQVDYSPENDEVSPAEHQKNTRDSVHYGGALGIEEFLQLGRAPCLQQFQKERGAENDGKKHESAEFVAAHVARHHRHG